MPITRFPCLFGNSQNEIHYFSIVNSLMITLFLTGVVAMIMLRTLRKDITTYNEVDIGLERVPILAPAVLLRSLYFLGWQLQHMIILGTETPCGLVLNTMYARFLCLSR